jgi:hypothetical protein
MMFGPIRREAADEPRLIPDDPSAPASVSRARTMIVHAGLVLFAVAILARADRRARDLAARG